MRDDTPQHRETQRQVPETELGQESARPFDNSGLNDVPQPRSDDPPYRDWWVVETSGRTE